MNAAKSLLFAVLSGALCVEAQQPPKPVISVPPAGATEIPPEPTTTVPPAAAPASTEVSSAAAKEMASRYILSPDDTVQVTVFKEPGFSASVPVRPDGMISMTLLGDIPAAGQTPMQLGTAIEGRLKKYINDPSVTVTVLTVKPKQVYLLGEVSHIGGVALTRDMSVLQVIAAAGGLSPYAKSKSIYILRGEPGHQTKIPFNYKKALKEGNEQGVVLVPGDTIVVP